MAENNFQKDGPSSYDIEFVDPDDLVGFISEIPEDQAPLSLAGEKESERAPKDDLKFTDFIRESWDEYIQRRREDTRGRLAVIYTICTFLIFLLIIIVAVIDGLVRHVSIVEDLNTLLPLVSGIFLGTLGFVLGYYFRRENDR